MDNVLHKVTQTISISEKSKVKQLVMEKLKPLGKLYSYLIYSKYKNNELDSWLIEYNFSQVDDFNTMSEKDVAEDVFNIITKDVNNKEKHYVAGYKQPDVNLMIQLFEPLVKKLAFMQHERWQQLEMEDLYQMCMMCMCKLYNQGYYVHKSLLQRAFNNAVLMHIRKDKNAPVIISFEDLNKYYNNDMSAGDNIRDESAEYEMCKAEENEDKLYEILKNRKLVVDVIGQRRYDQLVREYGNRCTTVSGRRTVSRLKEKFNKEGIKRRK